MGCVGMSLKDFERCTPSEFNAVVEAWNRHEEMLKKRSWEQTRTIAVWAMQPYCKKTLDPAKVMPFDWDKKNPLKKVEKSTRERMEEIKARLKENQ